MDTCSELVNPQVSAALSPFIRDRHDWILHYPVYLNGFCFAYDLAALLSGCTKQTSPDPLGGNFRRHDWWRGLPEFTYRRDIELFVATKTMISQAIAEGHDIGPQHCVLFTRYDVKWVFVRNRKMPAKRWLVVTDVPQTSEELLDAWKSNRPGWLSKLGNVQLSKDDIRKSFQRELHDLFADDGKIYIFSAPMAYMFKQQSAHADARYKAIRAGAQPIDTYYVFRCNSGVDPARLKELRTAIADYYGLIFGTKQPELYLHPNVASEYGRIASTVGQPQPFSGIHLSPGALSGQKSKAMVAEYGRILRDHHHA